MTKAIAQSSIEEKVCLARQPILNSDESIIAYEILFRKINSTDANIIDGTVATADVIINLLSNIGLDNVIGEKKAFINFDQYLLQNDIIKLLPKDRVVIEILEDVVVDNTLYTHLDKLVHNGYTLAIDDFIDNESTNKIFGLVKIMKIDITDYSNDQLEKYAELGKHHGLTLLAERVETRDEFLFCKKLGFELFQGYFFAKPEYIEKASIPSNKMSIMSILNDIMSDVSINKIEKKVTHNVSISYKLLQYINSAGLRRETTINNIQDAIQLIGIKPLYRWLSLFLFSNDDGSSNDSTLSLFSTALMRGFFLEYIASIRNKEIANDLFVLGVFSFLDTLLHMPLTDILKEINISKDIKDALLNKTGTYYEYYLIAILNDENAITNKNTLNLDEDDISNANIYAMQSTHKLLMV